MPVDGIDGGGICNFVMRAMAAFDEQKPLIPSFVSFLPACK